MQVFHKDPFEAGGLARSVLHISGVTALFERIHTVKGCGLTPPAQVPAGAVTGAPVRVPVCQ